MPIFQYCVRTSFKDMWPLPPTFILIVDTNDTTVYAHFPEFIKKKKGKREREYKNIQANPSHHHTILSSYWLVIGSPEKQDKYVRSSHKF